MKAQKISNPAKNFIDYSYKGDGKYYTTEQGSKSYRNTCFSNFQNNNSDCFEIIESGNDAPRGGKTGDYVVVKFNPIFMEKFGWYFEKIVADKKAETEKKAQKEAFNTAILEEANSMNIDDEFKNSMVEVNASFGQAKQELMITAIKSLLSRLGKEKIATDFWQVVRILKRRCI